MPIGPSTPFTRASQPPPPVQRGPVVQRGGIRSSLMPFTDRRVVLLDEAPAELARLAQLLRFYGLRDVMPAANVLVVAEHIRQRAADVLILPWLVAGGDSAATIVDCVRRTTATTPEIVIALPKVAPLPLRNKLTSLGFTMREHGDDDALLRLVAGGLERRWQQRQNSRRS